MRDLFVLVLLALSLTLAAGCSGGKGTSSAPGEMPRINGGGATFVAPIMQKWSGEYKSLGKAEIDYKPSGSGVGIENATKRTFDFGCSDAPMNAKELEKAKAEGGEMLNVPVAIGAVAVVYNLDGVKDLKLSGEVLAEIYTRKITTWNDPQILKLNPGVDLPAKAITPVARNESSGTTNIFTEYLSKRSAEFKKSPGTSKSPKWPEGVEKKEKSDGVVDFVKNTAGSVGYAELSYAKSNGLPAARIVNKAGKPVAPDAAATTAAVDAVMKEAKDKEPPYSLHPLAYSFTDAGGDTAYPIVGASYALLYKKQPNDKGPALVAFLKWAVSDGQKFAEEMSYAQLPGELTKKAQDLLGTVTTE